MTNFKTLSHDDGESLGSLANKMYRHVLATEHPDNNRVMQSITSKAVWDLKAIKPGLRLVEQNLGNTHSSCKSWEFQFENKQLKIEFNHWGLSDVHAKANEKWVEVTDTDGPWIKELHRLLKNIDIGFKRYSKRPTERETELVEAAKGFEQARPKKVSDNPLTRR